MKTLLLLLLLNGSAQAEPKKGQEAHVLQMDSDFPLEDLEGLGTTLHPLSEMSEKEELLTPNLQEQFFQEAGLSPFVKGWDVFDKDRLALRAENQTASEVAARYEGKIPTAAIQAYQYLVRKHRAARSKR
jgi:hypothetical protein